jgi:hypothetical protein
MWFRSEVLSVEISTQPWLVMQHRSFALCPQVDFVPVHGNTQSAGSCHTRVRDTAKYIRLWGSLGARMKTSQSSSGLMDRQNVSSLQPWCRRSYKSTPTLALEMRKPASNVNYFMTSPSNSSVEHRFRQPRPLTSILRRSQTFGRSTLHRPSSG